MGEGAGDQPVGDRDHAAVIERMRWWDIARASQIEHELFPTDAWTQEFWWHELATPGRQYYVARVQTDGAQSAVVGFCGLAISGREAEIMNVGVATSAQGLGIAKALLDTAFAACDRSGVEVVFLDVAADNSAALGLYALYGFSEVNRRKNYYQHADALVMRARVMK